MRITELRDFHSRNALASAGIRNPQSRVTALEDRWHRMRQVITERSQDPEMQSVPGGSTGLVVMTFKQLGSGKDASVVREYRVDTALLAEIRAHEQQAAEELGQWTTRKETMNQSVSLSISDPCALNDAIKLQLSNLPSAERSALLELAPPELAAAISAEFESPSPKAGVSAEQSGRTDGEVPL